MCKYAASNCQVKCNCISVTSTSLCCLWKTDRCSLCLKVTDSLWSHVKVYFWTFSKSFTYFCLLLRLFFPVCLIVSQINTQKTGFNLVGKNVGCYAISLRQFSFKPGFLHVFCLSVMTYIELSVFPAQVLAVSLPKFIKSVYWLPIAKEEEIISWITEGTKGFQHPWWNRHQSVTLVLSLGDAYNIKFHWTGSDNKWHLESY